MADVPDDSSLMPEFPPVMHEEPPPWRPGDENPAWTLWETLGIFVVFLVSVLVAAQAAAMVALRLGVDRALGPDGLVSDPRIIVPAQTVAYVFTVLFIFMLVRTHADAVLPAVRWNFPGRQVAMFVGAGIVLSLAVQVGGPWLLPMPKTPLPIEGLFRNATDAWIMAAFGCTVAPFVEELLFRGILYPALARRVGMMTGIIVTAIGFTLLHMPQLAFAWAPLLMLFAVGVVLTVVRAWSGSVGASFLVHVGYNFTIFVLVWLSTDHFRHMERIAS